MAKSLLAYAQAGDAQKVKILLGEGVDVNATDEDGNTALMLAAPYPHDEVVEILLSSGADVNGRNGSGVTALMVASGFAESEIVDLLLSEGAHVDAKDIQGRTALMYAAGHNQERTKNTDVVERLILEGANIETQDEGGRTSLMYAVRRCNLDEAELLLGKGADPLLTDSDGRTIFELDIQYQANLFETDYYERDSQKNCQQLAALLAEVKVTLAPEEVKGKPIEGEPVVTQHLGTITYQEAPKTWTINVPEGSEKVEVAIYGYGKENEQGMYGGWSAYLKVNGKYAWEFIRYDKELGGVIYDHLRGEEVLEVNGKDSYYDVTSMVTPGENTITYYHFTDGPGIGVKVRIHRKV